MTFQDFKDDIVDLCLVFTVMMRRYRDSALGFIVLLLLLMFAGAPLFVSGITNHFDASSKTNALDVAFRLVIGGVITGFTTWHIVAAIRDERIRLKRNRAGMQRLEEARDMKPSSR